MTFGQYMRRVLVTFIPLLAVGWLFAKLVVPYGDGAYITCEVDPPIGENCRNVGGEGRLHDYVQESHPAWFTVDLPEQRRMPAAAYAHVTGSTRTLATSRILSASPSPLTTESGRNVMTEIVGRPALIQLGATEKERSFILDGDIIQLKCNELRFGPEPTRYDAYCFGYGWDGLITFTAGGGAKQSLGTLRAEAVDELDEALTDYRTYQAVMYPLFVYMFLVGSATVWLIRRAYRFVRG